jgi:hypothetical protein
MGVLLGVAVGAAGIGSGCGNPPNASAAQQCFSIWEDSLPQGAQLAGFEAAGQELRVRYRHPEGSGEVRCATLKDGALDDTASINLKSDFLWDHPEIAPRL